MADLAPIRWPIGAIVRELEATLHAEAVGSTALEQRDRVYALYLECDEIFARRPDYRLWRSIVPPYFAFSRPIYSAPQTHYSVRWEDWTRCAQDCLRSKDPLIIWSMIALSPEIMLDHVQRHDLGPASPIWDFAARIHELLSRPLRPLNQSPASCGMAAVNFLIRYQNIYHKARRTLDAHECSRFMNQLRHWLRIVDLRFEPGGRLDTTQMEEERLGRGRLRAGHNAAEYSQLTGMLSVLRPLLSQSIDVLTPLSKRLLQDAYHFGMTAWLTARSRRIDEMQYQHRQPHPDYRKIRSVFLMEFKAHLNLSNAARDAGRYLDAGKHLYLLYRLIPDAFLRDSEVRRELENRSTTIRYLKEVGLELDPRSSKDENTPEIQRKIQKMQASLEAKWQRMRRSEPDESLSGRFENDAAGADPSLSKETGFMLRVRNDQQRLSDWHQIFSEFDPLSESPVGFLLTLMRGLADARLPADPATLASAYRLALKYGFVRSAGKILDRAIAADDFPLEDRLLLHFVHSVKRCTQLDPFGMHHERLQEWQDLITAGYDKLHREGETAALAPKDRLWIHETVINRTMTHHRSLSAENAARLYEKAMGAYDVGQLREFYDLSFDFTKRTPGIADVETVSGHLRCFAADPLGAPVAVSIMRTPGIVSLLAVGSDGSIYSDDVNGRLLQQHIDELRVDAEYWFKFQGEGPVWPRAFERLASTIKALARKCDASARVLLLSMDAEMAGLPWQHLLGREGDSYLAAIVPSFSALTWNRSYAADRDSRIIISEETGDEIKEIGAVVRGSTSDFPMGGTGISIIAGHGSPADEGDFPGVRIGNGARIATLNEWLDVVGSRMTILHCCHGGTTGSIFMREFGGVPGLAISLGAQSFIAPVSEVSVVAACTLQRAVFEEPSASIGSAYLQAVQRVAECTLYNIYGNPYQSVAGGERKASVPSSLAA